MKNKRKGLSLFVLLCFIFTLFPYTQLSVQAFDQDKFEVHKVTIGKTFDRNRILSKSYVLIEGAYLKDAEVGIVTDAGGYEALKNRTTNAEGILQFEFTQDIKISKLKIESTEINIAESTAIPVLTGVDRATKVGNDLNAIGTNLNSLTTNADIEVKIGGTIIDKSRIEAASDGKKAVLKNITGNLGLQDIVFTRIKNDSATTVFLKYTYEDQFRLIQDLKISPDLEMFPNRGEAPSKENPDGDEVLFRATELDDYDVFFLKDINGTDPYTDANKGTKNTYKIDAEGQLDILKTHVPAIALGEYYVVLTNKISPGKDPMKEVTGEFIIRVDNSDPSSSPEKFTVIEGKNKANILSIQPSQGPDSGSPATISGQFLGSINISDLTLMNDYISEDTISDKKETLTRKLSGSPVGTYKKNIKINTIERTIDVIIGNKALFREGSTFTNDLDSLEINIAQVTDAAQDPKKDVVVETQTILTDDHGKKYVFKERAVKTKGYTFIPSKIGPEISEVTPDLIQVQQAEPDKYEVPEDRLVAIHGKNFMIHRFEKEGAFIVRYPIVELGEIKLDKNIEKDLTVLVLDDQGKVLDGSSDNEIGTKIIVTIPKGRSVKNIGKSYVKVTNPVRNSDQNGLYTLAADKIEFVSVGPGKIPIIESVVPDIVAVDGGQEVVIKGSNFANSVKVFIDGEEVKGIVRQGDGREIRFKAPKGREGETQLQVMNPEGGMAIHPFTYVKTYTDPKIFNFNPKKGKTGTLVVIKGDNFLKPDPTVNQDAVLKLIGSRVLLEGIEVNTYNLDRNTKRISLEKYTLDTPLLEVKDLEGGGKYICVNQAYSGLILKESSGKLYTLDINEKKQLILNDGVGNKYEFLLQGDAIVASKEGGGTFSVSATDESLEINADPKLSFSYLTPFKEIDWIDGSKRLGNLVRVVDKNTIHVEIPKLEAEGFYDLTVINPDTKQDSKKDQQGFYYYKAPQTNPVITQIFPNEGSVEGGYTIDIKAISNQPGLPPFTDDARVFINGVEVPVNDTVISPDGSMITVKVPKYAGDMYQDKGVGRLTVPVVVLNSDGGSASKEDGFTYVIPGSHPEITKIVPQKGSAAGGEVVDITVKDLRFYEPYDDKNKNQIFDGDEEYNDVDNNGKWTDLRDPSSPELINMQKPIEHERFSYYYDSPVLPKVYFGKEQAKIVEFDIGFLKVITPPGPAGAVDVYIVNNDSGISKPGQFTYEGSGPKISSVVPEVGKKQGRDKVEVNGQDFFNSTMKLYRNGSLETVQMPMVYFGQISNHDIPPRQDNDGSIDGTKASVTLDGGLQVDYDAKDKQLKVILTEGKVVYGRTFFYEYNSPADSIRFIDLQELVSQVDGSTHYEGFELVRVQVKDRRLLVQRGYAPEVELVNRSQIIVHTPSHPFVGKTNLTLINPDQGTAEGKFEYKNPDSKPAITNITRDGKSPQEMNVNGLKRILRVNHKGKSVISVFGTDFRENASIQVGDSIKIDYKSITPTLPNKLTFTMPDVAESEVGKLYRVVVINEDGGTAASDKLSPPIFIQITKGETEPQVTGIKPALGPASGGTRVSIEGKDFRGKLEGFAGEPLQVFFGEHKASDVEVVDYKTIKALSPSNIPGKLEVRIENPDGQISIPAGDFTYISTPKITAVVDASDPTENTRVRTISVEGGQEIKIKGSGFMPGAKVVFMPELETAADTATPGQNILYRPKTTLVDGKNSNILSYSQLKSGIDGTDTKFIDAETLTVKVPAGKLDGKGIIVVNPDNGASDPYDDIKYGLPGIDTPKEVKAEIIHDQYGDTDRFIKVTWEAVEKATQYDIYVVVGGKNPEYIGSTKLTSFLYKDLEPRTYYKFIVKAVGDFGSSAPSLVSNEVRTGSKVGAPDTDGGLGENTEQKKVGNTAEVVIGSRDFDLRETVIDLTRGPLAGSKEVLITMPAEVVTSYRARDIEVIGPDFSLRINPNAFNIGLMQQNKNRSDAGIRFRMVPGAVKASSPGQTALSNTYTMYASSFVGKSAAPVDILTRDAYLAIDYDSRAAEMRRLTSQAMYRWDASAQRWATSPYWKLSGLNGMMPFNRMGSYAVMGTRR